MSNVFIACGAGVSSTFLALKLRSLSQSQTMDISFFPSAISNLQATDQDLVLVASHLAQDAQVDDLSKAGVSVITLPEHANGDFKAEDAMELIIEHLQRQRN